MSTVVTILGRMFWVGEGGALLFIVTVVIIILLATSKRSVVKRCARCQEVNRPHATFCSQCGTKLDAK